MNTTDEITRHRTVTREQFVAMSAEAPVVDAARFLADLDTAVDPAPRDPYAR